MSRNNSIAEGWPEVCQLVEEILKARAITTTRKIGQTEFTRRKPMKFADFAKEIGRDRAEAYRWIRNGQVPDLKNQKIVKAWTKKHAKALIP